MTNLAGDIMYLNRKYASSVNADCTKHPGVGFESATPRDIAACRTDNLSTLRKILFLLGGLLFLFGLTTPATAHRLNESYVYFQVTDDALTGRIEIAMRDLAQAFPGFESGESITEADVKARAQEIFDYFADRLQIRTAGQVWPIRFEGVRVIDGGVDTFTGLEFSVPGLTPTPDSIDLSYEFLFSDIDPGHLGYALIESNTRTGVRNNESYISLIFRPSAGPQTLSLVGQPAVKVFFEFIKHGIWHIWLGFDHVLFLITLLLTAVMVRHGRQWTPAPGLRGSMINVIKIVTFFTVAHTITLSLAAFGVVQLPQMLVESVIALSIAAVALGNLYPTWHMQSWMVVFTFGLFHGFGFANVLAPLGIDPARKVVGLAAFNIGVEIGQIAIVLVVFPVLYALRNWSAYRFLALRLGSVALIAVALFWFVERTYDLLGPVKQTLWQLVS